MAQRGTYPRNPTVECIAARPRRQLVHALSTWGPRLDEQRLAAYLAATNRGTPSLDTTDVETVRKRLAHVHLPALETAGLVTRMPEEGVVRATTHPALDDPRFERLLELQAEELDQVLSALAHEYRRVLLTVLEDERAPMGRTELAEEIDRRAPRTVASELPDVERIATSLHHVHLPKLDTMDLAEYDPESGRTTHVKHPALTEVFTVIYEPDEFAVDKLGGFFDGLADACPQPGRGANNQLDWPHFWRDPHHG